MADKKVFCKSCRYYRHKTGDMFEDNLCVHENNAGYTDTPVARVRAAARCEDANKGNKCKLFLCKKGWFVG